MIVTVGSMKSGAGKSKAGRRACLGASPGRAGRVAGRRGQQTTIPLRAEAGRLPAPACVWFPNHRMLGPQMRSQARRDEVVVLDAGGRYNLALRTAVQLCDVLLVPVRTRSSDVWALADMVQVIDEVSATREGLRAYAVPNAAAPGVSPPNAQEAAVAEFPQFTLLDRTIRQRKALAIALGFGLAVDELTPRDPKACCEIADLTNIVRADAVPIRRISNGNANHQAGGEAGRPPAEAGAQGVMRESRADHRDAAPGDFDRIERLARDARMTRPGLLNLFVHRGLEPGL
jgi:chromosome partitioning protein